MQRVIDEYTESIKITFKNVLSQFEMTSTFINWSIGAFSVLAFAMKDSYKLVFIELVFIGIIITLFFALLFKYFQRVYMNRSMVIQELLTIQKQVLVNHKNIPDDLLELYKDMKQFRFIKENNDLAVKSALSEEKLFRAVTSSLSLLYYTSCFGVGTIMILTFFE